MTIEQFEQIKKEAKLMGGNIGPRDCNILLNAIDRIIEELERRSKLPAVVYSDEADYAIDLAKAELARDLLGMVITK